MAPGVQTITNSRLIYNDKLIKYFETGRKKACDAVSWYIVNKVYNIIKD